MTLAEAILAAMLALPAPYADTEPDADRRARLERIALAVSVASETAIAPYAEPNRWPGTAPELAAMLTAKAFHESGRFDRGVHLGGAVKDRGGYAISLWQLHTWRLVPYAEWRGLGGLAGTEPSAHAAARVLSFARKRCGAQRPDWRDATIALYATGKRCSWKGAASRAWLARRVEQKILAQLAPQN